MAESEYVSREELREVIRRLETAEQRLNRGDVTLALINQSLTTIDQKLSDLMAWKTIEQDKPAKRWDGVVTQIISIIVAAAAGFAVSKLF
ncbi:MAG: hypothetical protein MJZ85_06795 [Bacteroidales bacterium]|nr:hypothetical protein [Bacteroidales bacterium]